jgi:PTH1 family peptidyl-tRNA hydrolase
MKLIVGLGNPGAPYARSRHNVGFRVVDRFAERHRLRFELRESQSLLSRGRVAGQGVVVAKPQTFMNRSGEAVAPLVWRYTESIDELMVVYDDVDLPLGKVRIRPGGSGGTHNGMKSILDSLETDAFPRLRFGIRGLAHSREDDLADYVLEEFDEQEEPIVAEAVERAAEALVLFVRGELNRAMNEFNRDPVAEGPSDLA